MNTRPFLSTLASVARLAGLLLLSASPWLAAPALARDGVEVGGNSAFSKLVPAADVERSATTQYAQLLQQAAAKNALGGPNHPQVLRLRAIATRIIPHSYDWNARARDW